MASEQLWGSLVKAMTRKIEMPRIGNQGTGEAPSPYRKPPTKEVEAVPVPNPGDRRNKAGRRASDPLPDPPAKGTQSGQGSTSVTSPESCIERIVSHLSYLTKQQIDDYLSHHGGGDGAVTSRLSALGLIPSGTRPSGPEFWWKAVSEGWVEPELLAEVLRSSPGIPENNGGPLFDFILDADIAPYREVKDAGQTALEDGKPILDVLEG